MSNTPALRTRKPSGQAPWPLILLDGEEGAGKSLAPAVLSADQRVGITYWIDLGEGSGDEYGSVPDARYEIVEHDGSYRGILEAVTAVRNEAERAAKAGEPPVVITIDSGSALWGMLKNWTTDRARRSKNGQRQLAADPDAPIKPSIDLWNDATDRWLQIVRVLQSFPGIAIITARSKDVSAMDDDGRPIKGEKERSIEAQKSIGHDASAVIHMVKEPRGAELTKVRSLRVQVPDGGALKLPTKAVGSWQVVDLAAFVFDILGCAAGETKVRDMVKLRGDNLEGLFDEMQVAPTEEDLKAIWDRVNGTLTPEERAQVLDVVNARLQALRTPAAEPAETSGTPSPVSDAAKLAAAAQAKLDASENAA